MFAFTNVVHLLPHKFAGLGAGGLASAFVLPSQSEGISLTILEAMACGLPVVATRVGGNPEVVDDGRTGLLVPPRDPAALGRALVHLAGHVEQAQAMGRAGRDRAEAHFDVRKMIAAYEALYDPRDSLRSSPDQGVLIKAP